ncbi:hypothetical protein FIBSPDRAFT_330017 [Athelia psychrophila]|uniref:Uncharacterized protein n=1 Tax=Athelia psychrophila TaxID=1759441 RepID=A0A167WI91_9AGAM|nr:hypothetical protein FIBSPDRAFT_330017 [Fibularhizoctonia sp. CBS 109695]
MKTCQAEDLHYHPSTVDCPFVKANLVEESGRGSCCFLYIGCQADPIQAPLLQLIPKTFSSDRLRLNNSTRPFLTHRVDLGSSSENDLPAVWISAVNYPPDPETRY